MIDRAHHGFTFMAGLALVLALSASACVAGEVGDESELQSPGAATQADEPNAEQARRADVEEEQVADPDEEAAPPATARPASADLPAQPVTHKPRTAACTSTFGTRTPEDCEPPPVPWMVMPSR